MKRDPLLLAGILIAIAVWIILVQTVDPVAEAYSQRSVEEQPPQAPPLIVLAIAGICAGLVYLGTAACQKIAAVWRGRQTTGEDW